MSCAPRGDRPAAAVPDRRAARRAPRRRTGPLRAPAADRDRCRLAPGRRADPRERARAARLRRRAPEAARTGVRARRPARARRRLSPGVHLLTPDRGLLHLLFGAFFFIQLLTTLAGTSGRTALLRSLTVLFGAAFVLRYIVLESLYAPTGGTLATVLTVLLEGVSLGRLQYEPAAPATGYLAFLALALYLVGLFLLRAPHPQELVRGSRTVDATADRAPAGVVRGRRNTRVRQADAIALATPRSDHAPKAPSSTGTQPSATNCTVTCPRFGASATFSSGDSASKRRRCAASRPGSRRPARPPAPSRPRRPRLPA